MYKVILTHHVIPGKLPALIRWHNDADKARKEAEPEYVPFKRYITVLGNLTRFVVEVPLETLPEHPIVWAEGDEGAGVYDMVIPGQSEMVILKEI